MPSTSVPASTTAPQSFQTSSAAAGALFYLLCLSDLTLFLDLKHLLQVRANLRPISNLPELSDRQTWSSKQQNANVTLQPPLSRRNYPGRLLLWSVTRCCWIQRYIVSLTGLIFRSHVRREILDASAIRSLRRMSCRTGSWLSRLPGICWHCTG